MSGRRANGEGSVRKRADGRYEARYTGADGKSHSIYGKRRADVVARLRDETAAAEMGVRASSRRDTVAGLLANWLSSTEGTVRRSTWAQRESHIRVHIIPAIGHLRASKLSPDDVQAMLNSLSKPAPKANPPRKRPLAPRSVHHVRATLRAALNDALKKRLVAWNVAELARAPRLEEPEVRALDAGGARVFLEAIAEAAHGPLYTVALVYGLRLGEALGLRWSDIGLHEVSIRQSFQRVRRQSGFVPPKSAMARRTLPRFEVAEAALKLQRARVAAARLKAGPLWEDNDLVFPNAVGRPLNPSSTTRRLHETLELLGLPDMNFHALRHSCASIHNELGTDPRTIQSILGHTSPAVTMKVYTHITASQIREAARRMDAAFGVTQIGDPDSEESEMNGEPAAQARQIR